MWFRRIAEFLALVSLIVIIGGVWYLAIQQGSQLPQWIGYVLASFTGGMLALLGGYFTSLLGRQTEKYRLQREQRLQQIEPYRKYLVSLYSLLSRKVLAHELSASEVAIAQQLDLSGEDLRNVVLSLPPLREMSLIRNTQLQRVVENVTRTGVLLLLQNGSHESLQKWGDECRTVLNQLDLYESSSL